MNLSLRAIRLFFSFISILLFIAYSQLMSPVFPDPIAISLGTLAGLGFFAFLLGLEKVFKDFNLLSFNTTTIGLLCGWAMGETLLLIFQSIFDHRMLDLFPSSVFLLKLSVLLAAIYFGLQLTVKAAGRIRLEVPFLKIDQPSKKKKILLDPNVLGDQRFFDLAQSGLLDDSLLFPRSYLTELQKLCEASDEGLKIRKQIEIIQKLESIPNFNMEFIEQPYNCKESFAKLIAFAKEFDAHILTTDIPKVYQSQLEGIKVINLNLISQVLKPVTMAGEVMNIKVQRYGKEPRQGVGYLEDGTMVVINGGGEFIGETIKANVLSVKHTTSGRMIFCNVVEPGMCEQPFSEELESSPHNFFAV